MSRYSIEGSTLTAIGDAVRAKVGETRVEYIPAERHQHYLNLVEENLDEWELTEGDSYYKRKHRFKLIPDVVKYKFKYTAKNTTVNDLFSCDFQDDNGVKQGNSISLSSLTGEEDVIIKNVPSSATYVELKELIWWRDISLLIEFNLEIIPLDEDGNEITEIPITVENTLTPIQMAEKINNIPPAPPESAFTITGNCSYRFGYNSWNWFIEEFGNKIITKDITNAPNMFLQSGKLISIPFDINGKTDGSRMSLSYLFDSCHNLTNIPKITGKVDSTNNMFNHCRGLRELKEESITELDWSYIDTLTSNYSGNRSSMFQSCYSLRKYPNSFLAHGNPVITYSYAIYYGLFNECFVLDEIVDLPIQHKAAKWTSNAFNNTFKNCARIKKLTFETNEDGSPIVVNGWSKQTIDLSSYIGYISTSSVASITGYNSGITKDKQVTDAASYQALKNDPDWFSTNIDYSRYNHDSAVETINTLPDLSGGAGGNIIKFKGAAGALTDGGAINTLTEEEIAVATVKGWTVSLV